MIRWYLETSAALKLIIDEAESDAMSAAIAAAQPNLLACWLLETEMRRTVARHPQISQELVTDVLEEIDLVGVPSALFRQASYLPGPHLRSLDALHVAAALRADVDVLVTYDLRVAESARSLGLRVLSPA